jgi:hypothetical protein
MSDEELKAINEEQRKLGQEAFFEGKPFTKPSWCPEGYEWGIAKYPHESCFWELTKI